MRECSYVVKSFKHGLYIKWQTVIEFAFRRSRPRLVFPPIHLTDSWLCPSVGLDVTAETNSVVPTTYQNPKSTQNGGWVDSTSHVLKGFLSNHVQSNSTVKSCKKPNILYRYKQVMPGKFWNVVVEKDGENLLDRSCEKWESRPYDTKSRKREIKNFFPLQAWTGPWGSRRSKLQNF